MASQLARSFLLSMTRSAALSPAPAVSCHTRSFLLRRAASLSRFPSFSAAPSARLANPSVGVRFFSESPVDPETQAKLDAMEVPPINQDEVEDPKINALVDQVLSLNMMENMIFMRTLQKRLGITDEMIFPTAAAAPAAPAASSAAGDEGGEEAPVEESKPAEKVAFTVKITELGSGRVKVMKEIRTLTGFGLKEVQSLANNLPASIGENLDKEKADKWAEALQKAGATVEIE
eukprot:TRINITY_DN11599_c0_g2_i1.p1 TRINITY_DN11599_c0_g2~~TRINITY_DN11599_c0_g2_i1.p1  ORF type:complete len:233 (+),score=73.49 TRINITY_DN11599_c0_g2_i1:145-843(+)